MGKRSSKSKGKRQSKGGSSTASNRAGEGQGGSARNRPSPAAANYAGGANQGAVPSGLFGLGILALAVAAGAALTLAIAHVAGLSAPGCGKGTACAELASGYWGKVPGTQWPVSFVGSAYFLGALVAWLFCRNGVSAAFRNLVRLGALGSAWFAIIMIKENHFCLYCVATHVGNLVFWLIIEKTGKRASVAAWRPVIATALVFIVASAVMGAANSWEAGRVTAGLEKDVDDSTDEVIRRSNAGADPPGASFTVNVMPDSPDAATNEPSTPPPALARPVNAADGFTGRYRLGPEEARVRIVMITDYQCSDCIAVEAVARQVVETYDDVSLSIKHFPMCADCNRNFKNKNMHPQACNAARAAEAAGILGGNDVFWKMHHWLFDQEGDFSGDKADLGGFLASVGIAREQFDAVAYGNQTLELVQDDIQEAIDLGLFFTPMVFINGGQIRGLFEQSAGRLRTSVQRILNSGVEPATAAADHPPLARQKYLDDWRHGTRRRLPPAAADRFRGTPNAPLRIVVFGDYQEPNCAKVDRIIRKWIGNREDAYYAFRHYPFDQSCNTQVSRTVFARGCRASRAAEAGGILGGRDGYWKVHTWLIENQPSFEAGDAGLQAALPALGFNPQEFFQTMQTPAVSDAIAQDAVAGKRQGMRSIPMIFVNDRHIPRWHKEGDRILERIFSEAEGVPFPE